MRLAHVLALVLVSAFSNSTPARTWYVAADGSGDAPTIAAAVDSSISGDVILVGPGTHFVSDAATSGVSMKSGTQLLSENGPSATFLRPGALQPGLISAHDNCVVSGFNMLGSLAATLFVGGDHVEISNNVVGAGPSGVSALSIGGDFVSIHHNVFFGSSASIFLGSGALGVEIFNNIILNGINHSGVCSIEVQVHCNLINPMTTCPFRFDNFSADPMFCGEGNYYLQEDSPCAPGNQPDGIDCGLIGPLPVACTPVHVEATTWGSIKAMYR